MLREILVCLEGSPSTAAATNAAIEIADLQRATLVGIAIVDEPDIRAGTSTSIGGSSFKHERDAVLIADARKKAADWIALFERRCRLANVAARTLEVVGRPAARILAELETHDLAVIGRDANFRFETEAEDNGTRDAILHRAARPVLLVPEAASGLGGKVVIAFDGSGPAQRAIASFVASGLGTGREIHVATVDDNGEEAWAMANRAVQTLGASGIAATAHNVVSAKPTVDAIIQLCAEVGAGMLVMGAFARSRLSALFTGSVTHGLLEQAAIPLYLHH